MTQNQGEGCSSPHFKQKRWPWPVSLAHTDHYIISLCSVEFWWPDTSCWCTYTMAGLSPPPWADQEKTKRDCPIRWILLWKVPFKEPTLVMCRVWENSYLDQETTIPSSVSNSFPLLDSGSIQHSSPQWEKKEVTSQNRGGNESCFHSPLTWGKQFRLHLDTTERGRFLYLNCYISSMDCTLSWLNQHLYIYDLKWYKTVTSWG